MCTIGVMADFNDVLGQLRAWKPEDDSPAPPATLYDDLAREYQRLADQRDGATVTLTERQEALTAKEAEIARLKGENYDLASRIGFSSEKESEKVPEEKPRGIEGLFVRRTKK